MKEFFEFDDVNDSHFLVFTSNVVGFMTRKGEVGCTVLLSNQTTVTTKLSQKEVLEKMQLTDNVTNI